MKKLSRNEMKNFMGGDAPTGGTCCTHTLDWVHFECNLSKAEAQAGQYQYWCCDSCAESKAKAGAN